jgi:UDP-glucose 4-epimerase
VRLAFYLVTGGCGFIGSHLTDALLDAGHRVRILDDLSTGKRANVRDAAEIVVGDVSRPDVVSHAMAGVDGCFHLAAIASVQRSNEEWGRTHAVNLTGAINVFDAARTAGAGGPVPVVYASSAAVYGDNPNVPLSEDAEKRPLTAYGADKLGCEQHARVAGNVHGVATTGFRFFNIYGPRQDPGSPYSGVISIFADRLASGRTATIYGDGLQVRDFVYVADCVRFVIAGMEKASTEAGVFNVCTGKPASLLDLVGAMSQGGRTLAVEHGPARVGDIRTSYGDPSRAEAAFGITAGTTLQDGLALLIDSLER